ncbi:MAG: type II toxin-antitoxin system RelE/ParE family toxin [Alphaproteobacteria bacterium]|nr:type II toxin-antitoxin system RelE/ParE family toxin [Alphaproteobacteria bacterium]
MYKNWIFVFKERTEKTFKSLEYKTQKQILMFVKKLEKSGNPRSIGEGLKGDKNIYWRYRVGNYRLLCIIQDNVLEVHAIKIGHRRDVYTK